MLGYAWFRLNAAEMYVDIEALKSGTAAQWISESGIVDLFIFSGSNPAAVTQQYADVTGTTAMPQLFSIGYHQCRWAGFTVTIHPDWCRGLLA